MVTEVIPTAMVATAMTESDTSTPFHFQPASLSPVGQPAFEDWAAVGEQLRAMKHFASWWTGDWWLYGEQQYGEVASQEAREELERETGSKYNTIRVAAWVASRYPVDARVTGVSFRHHQEVCALEPPIRSQLLAQARDEDWTIRRLRQEAKPYRQKRTLSLANVCAADITVLQGDVLAILPSLEPRFSLLIADPMAGGDRWRGLARHHDFLALLDAWLTRALQRLASSYHAFLWCPPDDLADLELHLRSRDLPVQSRIVWSHPNVTAQRTPVGLVSSWTPIVHLGTHSLRDGDAIGRTRLDVQEFAADGDTECPQKPFELLQWLVEIGSAPGDAVLDLFGGDATTAVACRALGRDCLVIEGDPALASVIRERLVGPVLDDAASRTTVETPR